MFEIQYCREERLDLVSCEHDRQFFACPMAAKVLELPGTMKDLGEEEANSAQGLIDRRSSQILLVLEVNEVLMSHLFVDLTHRIRAEHQE